MGPIERHVHDPDDRFDGGSMDCGSGLLLHLRSHLDPLRAGQLLEILSTESSVEEDLPAWCRLTGNDLVSWTKQGPQRSFLISKGAFASRVSAPSTQAASRPPPLAPPFSMLLPA